MPSRSDSIRYLRNPTTVAIGQRDRFIFIREDGHVVVDEAGKPDFVSAILGALGEPRSVAEVARAVRHPNGRVRSIVRQLVRAKAVAVGSEKLLFTDGPGISRRAKPCRCLVLGISGAAQAMSILSLVAKLHEVFAEQIDIILTDAARQFVQREAFSALGVEVWQDLFERRELVKVPHMYLAKRADLVAIIPASAHTIHRLAAGECSDLLSVVVAATRAPVVVAPSMNPNMRHHPSVQRNIAQLRADGVYVIEPAWGIELSRGESRHTSLGSIGVNEKNAPLAFETVMRFAGQIKRSRSTSAAECWQPILEKNARSAALEAIQAIAHQLRRVRLKDASLGFGHAGVALFFAYLRRARLDIGGNDSAQRWINRATETVGSTRMSASLFGGFTGVAWVMEHLYGWPGDTEKSDPNGAIDEALKGYLRLSPWRRDYDLIEGLVGFGVYALERMPRPSAIDCLNLVVERLNEIAVRTGEKVTWFTPPKLLPPWQRKVCPEGYFNLGVAHGVPGVIAFLGQVSAINDQRLTTRVLARSLLNGAVAWLLEQRSSEGSGVVFPNWIGPKVHDMPPRLAWCYGDFGVACALLAAARCAGKKTWEDAALVIAHRVDRRHREVSDIPYCGLCHGVAGGGHMFNRLFQATGERAFKKAAQNWFSRTLELRRPNGGIAGFHFLRHEGKAGTRWLNDPGLVEGAAGVGLALLAAVSSVEPLWDRTMLLSIPPRNQ